MKKLILGLLILVSCSGLFAQPVFQVKETVKNDAGEIIYARLNNVAVASVPSTDIDLLESIYGKIAGISFKFIREFKTSDGHINKLYQQYANDLVVEGANFSLHTMSGKAESVSGNYAKNLSLSAKATLLFNDAASAAEKMEKQKFPKAVVRTEGYEMVFSKNEIKNLGEYKLAYRVKVFSGDINNYKYYTIDAATGELLNIEYAICTGNVAGSGASLYTGTLNFTSDDFNTGAQFRLREVRNGVNINTLNNNHSFDETGAFATDFTDNDNNWTAAEHPNDRAAIDAHWGTEVVFDYWLNVHGRNSLDNAGMTINSYVHTGTSFDNGFWSPTNHAMFYGDGDVIDRPVTSLDWCGHELGHGVCQFTSNLTPGSTEPGALNEGFSDIWAAHVEATATPAKQHWLIFEETSLLSPFHERNMANPADGRYPQPDTYGGPHWGDLSNDPHINSGVLNHWFYLLSEGGSGTNGINNAFSLTGIGIDNAARIAYLTEQNLAPGSNYQNARTESILAARAIFGNNSCEEIAVTRAWFAVGVGANYAAPPVINATISGPTPMCSPSTFTISGVPAGYTITWTTSAPSIATVPPNSTGTSVVVTKVSNGTFYLIASYTSATVACNTYIQPTLQLITAGPYPDYGISLSGPYMVPLNYTTSYSVNLSTYPGITNMVWSWPAGWSCITGCSGSSSYVVLRSPSTASTGNINLSYTHCGVNGILATKWVAWGYGGPTYRVYPNPANNVLQIENINGVGKTLTLLNIRQIEIVDKMGLVAYRKTFLKGNLNTITIPVGALRNDIYTVRIFDGKEWQSYKIVIQH